MITFLIIVLSLGLGILIGSVWRQHLMIRQIVNDPDAMIAAINSIKKIIDDSEEEDNDIRSIEAYAELHNDRCFLYEKTTNRFLAQGDNVFHALQVAQERFPGTSITAS